MCFFRLISHRITVSYLGNGLIILKLVSGLLLIQGSTILLTSHCGRLQNLVSPWGAGRPGWHIECSAMNAHYLSPRFDIHGGGIDLNFLHHENEIAQTCAACEDSGVNYWLHNGHVTINGEKMAKSRENFKTIREITAEYHPLALRHFLMSAHYRSPLNYSVSQIEISSDSLYYYIYQILQDLVEALSPYLEALINNNGNAQETSEAEKVIKKMKSEFEANMSDDLNTTPILTGAFQDAMKFSKVKIPQEMPLPLVVSLLEVEKAVREVLDVLGLLSSLSYAELLKEMKQKALVKAKMSEEEIMHMIEERRDARRNKEWSKSDEIRKTLAIKGISAMDIPGEDTVVWRPLSLTHQKSTQHQSHRLFLDFLILLSILAFWDFSKP